MRYTLFLEKRAHRTLLGREVSSEEIKNTQEGLHAHLGEMEFNQKIKEIYEKYGLKREDYKGLRKLGKRFKASVEILKYINGINKFKQKAEQTAIRNNLVGLVGIVNANMKKVL